MMSKTVSLTRVLYLLSLILCLPFYMLNEKQYDISCQFAIYQPLTMALYSAMVTTTFQTRSTTANDLRLLISSRERRSVMTHMR